MLLIKVKYNNTVKVVQSTIYRRTSISELVYFGLTPTKYFSASSFRERGTFQKDVDVCLVVDQHTQLDFHSAKSLTTFCR